MQKVVELRTDCDQDCIWLRVDPQGMGACHVGYRSCFYRNLTMGETEPRLEHTGDPKLFDPVRVYASG